MCDLSLNINIFLHLGRFRGIKKKSTYTFTTILLWNWSLYIFFRMFFVTEKSPGRNGFAVSVLCFWCPFWRISDNEIVYWKGAQFLGTKINDVKIFGKVSGIWHLDVGWGRFFLAKQWGFPGVVWRKQTFFKDFPCFSVEQQGVMSDFFLQRLEDHCSEKVGKCRTHHVTNLPAKATHEGFDNWVV